MKKFTPILLLFILQTNALFCQVDTIPPVLTCSAQTNYYAVGGIKVFWPVDFIDSLYDNQSENIELGIRKACTGTGFPEESMNVAYTWETQCHIEIWARDEAGNSSTCIVDFSLNTMSELAKISITTPTVSHDTIEAQNIWNVIYHADAVSCFSDSLSFDLAHVSNEETWFILSGFPTPGYSIRLEPTKNDHPLNGVTTYDLLLITRHILGIEPLDSPYKIIAADANQDGKVTILDIIVLRKLILGITNELPNGKSWRFIPENYVFPNPSDPFEEPIPAFTDFLLTDELLFDLSDGSMFFKGVKIGDVNFSADPTQ